MEKTCATALENRSALENRHVKEPHKISKCVRKRPDRKGESSTFDGSSDTFVKIRCVCVCARARETSLCLAARLVLCLTARLFSRAHTQSMSDGTIRFTRR